MRSLSKCGAVELAAQCLAAEAPSEENLEEAKAVVTVPMDETDSNRALERTSSPEVEPKVCEVVVRMVVQVGAEALRWAETLTPLDRPALPERTRHPLVAKRRPTKEL
jgi:hypothetical protein